MTLTTFQKFLLVIFIQILVVVCLFAFNYSVVSTGKEIFLHIRPLDPTDPIRGDYVVFTFDISENYAYRSGEIPDGSDVYVPLCMNSAPYWQTCGEPQREITDTIDDVGKVFIKGKVQKNSIVFGIENYFIPEGTGRNINFNTYNAAAKVKVDQAGNAVLEKVYLDGKPWP